MANRAILIRFETIGFFGWMLLKTPIWSAPTLGAGMQIPVHASDYLDSDPHWQPLMQIRPLT